MVFARGLDLDALADGLFRMETNEGEVVEVTPWLFYGDNSHVVHLTPETNLRPDTEYRVTIAPGVVGRDGLETPEAHRFHFRTAVTGSGAEQPSCGCRTAAVAYRLSAVVAAWIVLVRRRRSSI